jgi:hypothetical protein
MLLVGIWLLTGSDSARWIAVLVVGLNAIAQIGFIVAFPLWAILLIALDVLVIYGLAARWDDEPAYTGFRCPTSGPWDRPWPGARAAQRRLPRQAP